LVLDSVLQAGQAGSPVNAELSRELLSGHHLSKYGTYQATRGNSPAKKIRRAPIEKDPVDMLPATPRVLGDPSSVWIACITEELEKNHGPYIERPCHAKHRPPVPEVGDPSISGTS
jgi:hypothetical protein